MLSELQALAEALAARLQRAVAIDDPQMRLLVHTPHSGDVDRHRLESIMQRQASEDLVSHVMGQGLSRATAPVRVPARPDLELYSRVCAPIRAQDELLGFLWLIDAEESLTDADIEIAAETARAAGVVMYRDRLLDDLQRGRERETVRDLLADDPAVRAHAADVIRQSDRLLARFPVVAVCAEIRVGEGFGNDLPVALDPVLHRLVRRFPPGTCVYLARADHAVVLAAEGKGALRRDEVTKLAAQLHGDLAKAVGADSHIRVGVGQPVADLVDAVSSYRQSRQAIRVAEIVPGFRDIVDFGELGIYALLVQLPLDRLPAEAIPPTLRKLIEVDASGQLVETLETYLDRAGDARATIEALRIHRTSLYYRLSRIHELTGLDLSDGGARLAVHLGLKLARLAGLISR